MKNIGLYIKKICNKKMLTIFMMGISSGLPLALIGGTLQAWMKSEGVNLTTIGLFASVGLPYTLKFLWAPFMDRFSFFKMGRRKSWMIVTQVLLILAIFGLAGTQPKENLGLVAVFALLVSFFSASQDIVLDAWRRESLPTEELGFGTSIHVAGYLLAFRLISGALALILSDHFSWNVVYSLMNIGIFLGIVATFLVKEPEIPVSLPRTFKESIMDPFIDYFSKPGAVLILLFIVLYKIGDNMAFQMSTPFYLDLGFSKTEIGAITKLVGWVSLVAGGFISGALMLRMRLMKALFLFGLIQGVATFTFVGLAIVGKSVVALTAVICIENIAVGMGTTAFSAFMASITNKKFTATQFALLTSFMGIPRTILVAPTGWMAEKMGWVWFFTFCTFSAIPGLLLILKIPKESQEVN